MTKDELIELAVGCGWKYHDANPGGYLDRGNWTISILSDGGLILKTWYKHLGKMHPYDTPDLINLKSVLHAPWLIGPFKEGWFSLKANRFVK